MITIKNTQRTYPIDTTSIKNLVKELLKYTGYEDFDVGVWITTDETIRKYNKQYRNKDKATTILSFPYHRNIKIDQKIQPSCDEDKNLGDIIISPKSVEKDAPKWSRSFEEHLHKLIVHSFCHLIGYTHDDEKDTKEMLKKEAELNPLLFNH